MNENKILWMNIKLCFYANNCELPIKRNYTYSRTSYMPTDDSAIVLVCERHVTSNIHRKWKQKKGRLLKLYTWNQKKKNLEVIVQVYLIRLCSIIFGIWCNPIRKYYGDSFKLVVTYKQRIFVDNIVSKFVP